MKTAEIKELLLAKGYSPTRLDFDNGGEAVGVSTSNDENGEVNDSGKTRRKPRGAVHVVSSAEQDSSADTRDQQTYGTPHAGSQVVSQQMERLSLIQTGACGFAASHTRDCLHSQAQACACAPELCTAVLRLRQLTRRWCLR